MREPFVNDADETAVTEDRYGQNAGGWEGCMNRQEFIAELRRAMSGDFSTTEIEDAVSYYEDYMDMQIKKGKREEEVLRELGNPRLIAKSMKAAGSGAGGASVGGGTSAGGFTTGRSASFDRKSSDDGASDFSGRTHMFRIPLWLVLLIVLFVLLAILSLVFRLLVAVLPIILVICGIVTLYRYFSKK